jgi:hypothetical protein
VLVLGAIPLGYVPGVPHVELAQTRWGELRLSANRVWRVLRRHGLNTRAKRHGLVAGYVAPPTPQRPIPLPERHLQVDHPGELVQLDCFCIGRLSGTKGTVWQDTAIDVASAYAWATLQVTMRNPRPAGPASSLGRWPPTWPAAAGSSAGHDRQRPGVPLGHLPATIAKLKARQAFSGPAGRRPMAVSSACSRPFWTSGGSPPLPAT